MDQNKGHVQRLGGYTYLLLATLLIICCAAYFIHRQEQYRSSDFDAPIYELTEWQTETGETFEMPHAFQYREDQPVYRISTVLEVNEEDAIGQTLQLYLKYCDLRVYLDGEEIYQESVPENGYSKTEGVKYLLIPILQDCKEKELMLEFYPLLGDSISYEVSVPLLSERGVLISRQIREDSLGIVAEGFMILLGVILIILGYIAGKRMQVVQNICLIGIFALTCGGYLFCQRIIVHMLFRNNYVLYMAEFTLLPLVIASVAMIERTHARGKIQKLFNVICVLPIVIIALEWLLNFGFGIDFRSTLLLTHSMMVIVLIGSVLIALRRKELTAQEWKEFCYGIIPVVIGGTIDMILYNVLVLETAIVFFKLGLFAFIIVEIYYSYIHYNEYNHRQMEMQTYQELALTDALTGIPNRMAYEKELRRMEEEKSLKACISIDLNRLKENNDTYGHKAGDRLIIRLAKILDKVAKEGTIAYRVGGDEFMVLLRESAPEAAEEVLEQIRQETMRVNASLENQDGHVSFASGISIWSEDDTSVDQVLNRADLAMYEEKRRQHEETENQY